jgi:[acyl-carrier-protein] S-malonyltransferase
MQKAVPPGVGAMAAVMKMPVDQLEALCAKHSQPDHRVEIANYNSDAQLVIAGHAKAVLHLCEDLQKLQIRYVDLPVSAPFHSSLMKPAKLEMQGLLESSFFAKNSEGIIANITGAVVRDYTAQYLIDQIDGPVRWIQSIDAAKNEGIQRFIEVGPGKVLFGLVRRMVPRDGFEVIATDDIVEAVKALS